MKLVIIEGTDNVGKDTVISQLINKFPVVKIHHCEKPKSTDPIDAAKEQYETFANLANSNVSDYIKGDVDCVIHNRSWYGEYIYGVKYRKNDPEYVISMCNKFESHLLNNIAENDICFITLLSNNADFLVKNDDGLSISNKKDDIIEETKKFEEIFNKSKLPNKHIIYVNEGENWRTKQSIMDEILTYIGL